MKNTIKKILAVSLAAISVLSAAGCSGKGESTQSSQGSQSSQTGNSEVKDLLDGVDMYDIYGEVEEYTVDPIYNNFAVTLAQKCDNKGENLLVSPISVIYALTMAANGADGETLSQFEKTLGADTYTLNRYLYYAMEGDYSGDPTKQSRANALWINSASGYKADSQYLLDVRTFFDANLFYADFNGSPANINTWMSEKSEGKITEAVDSVSEDGTMTLVNSLFFSAQWLNPYDGKNTKADIFNCADGSKSQVDFLNSTENYYISGDNAEGFIKLYDGSSYAFAAVLPKEGTSPEDYLQSLTGEKLTELFKSAEEESVDVAIPKLEQSESLSLADTLKDMGITDAFDNSKADFSKMGSSDKKLSLLDEINSEYVLIDEGGVNYSGANNEAHKLTGESGKKLNFNRPFIYFIFDYKTNIAKFIGIANNI